MTLLPIGRIRTPFRTLAQCPRNVDPEAGPECRLELDPEWAPALEGLAPGTDILVLYWLEGVDRARLGRPREGGGGRVGTFAIRSPHRPNPIGAAVVPVLRIEGGVVTVRGMDCLDGTALLDIKPAMRRTRRP